MVKGKVFKIDTEILKDKETESHLHEDLVSIEIELVPLIIILEDIEPDLSPAIEITVYLTQEDGITIDQEHLVTFQNV